jgi:hypothetical protein
METEEKGWPEWLLTVDPEMGRLLSTIDRHREALERSCASGYIYRRLGQVQVRQFEELVEKNRGFKAATHGKTVNFETLRKLEMPPAMLRAAVYNIAQRHQTVDAYRYCKKVVILKMTEAFSDGLRVGNLFSSFAALRTLLENLGALSLLAETLSAVKLPADSHDAGMVLDGIVEREFASRVDWMKVAGTDLRQTEDPRTLRTESTAESQGLAQWLASLGRRLNGAVAAYEVLSEFASPRVGSLWLAYEESKTMPDRARTMWHRNQMGVGFPRALAQEMAPTILQLFGILNGALGIIGQLDKEFQELDAKMARATREETRTWLWMFPELFDKHEDCPCGSGKRVKYCCGA